MHCFEVEIPFKFSSLDWAWSLLFALKCCPRGRSNSSFPQNRNLSGDLSSSLESSLRVKVWLVSGSEFLWAGTPRNTPSYQTRTTTPCRFKIRECAATVVGCTKQCNKYFASSLFPVSLYPSHLPALYFESPISFLKSWIPWSCRPHSGPSCVPEGHPEPPQVSTSASVQSSGPRAAEEAMAMALTRH